MPFPFHKNHKVDYLFLDPNNPRLPSGVEREENSIVAYLSHHAAVEELVSSIGENGFFFAEALVAIPFDDMDPEKITDETPLIVVEGNRRLTALKVLKDPESSPRKSIRSAVDEAEHRPDEVPIIVYRNRSDVLQFLGYRHITGVKPWEPLAKARYIQQIFAALDNEHSYEDRYREVAQIVGSKMQYVRRSLNALAGYEFAKERDFFEIGIDEDDIQFSFILTALGYTEIQSYVLGVDAGDEPMHIVERQSQIQEDRMRSLFRWMFEEGVNGTTRLIESRNIRKLAAIVASQKALERFSSGASIDQAYLVTRGASDEFTQYLRNADDSLTQASSVLAFVDYSEITHEVADNAFKQARHIFKTLDSLKPKE